MIRRINIFAGAGAGKSTLAGYLYYQFKRRHQSVEIVQEFIKVMAYKNEAPEEWDQWFIWTKQQRREEQFLRKNRVKYVITDSPVFLAASYGKHNHCPYADLLYKASDIYDSEYPAINIFLTRNDRHYKKEGRWQNLRQAKEMDWFLESQLMMTGREFRTFHIDDAESILKFLCHTLGIPYRRENKKESGVARGKKNKKAVPRSGIRRRRTHTDHKVGRLHRGRRKEGKSRTNNRAVNKDRRNAQKARQRRVRVPPPRTTRHRR